MKNRRVILTDEGGFGGVLQSRFWFEHGFQCVGGLFVPLLEGMGIDIHGGGGLGVPQPLGYGF